MMPTISDEILEALPPMPYKVQRFERVDPVCLLDAKGMTLLVTDGRAPERAALFDFLAAISHHYAPHQQAVLEARALGDGKG